MNGPALDGDEIRDIRTDQPGTACVTAGRRTGGRLATSVANRAR